MSDVLNHLYCGQAILKGLNVKLQELINKNIKMFNLGTQGPDFFFYDGALPWHKSIGMPVYGSKLHRGSTNEMFYEMLKIANSIAEQDEKDKAYAYVYGVLCHHALDSQTHPYINYISGVRDENKPETYIYGHIHKKVEVALDIAHTNFLNKESVTKSGYWQVFDMQEEDKKIIHYIYNELFEKLYNQTINAADINKCLDEAYETNKFACDKTGLKTILFAVAEKLSSKPKYSFTKAVYRDKLKDDIDYLNLNKSVWYNPCDEKISSRETYIDLFNKAVQQGIETVAAIDDLQIITASDVFDIVRDISFETGRIVDINDKMEYYNPIIK